MICWPVFITVGLSKRVKYRVAKTNAQTPSKPRSFFFFLLKGLVVVFNFFLLNTNIFPVLDRPVTIDLLSDVGGNGHKTQSFDSWIVRITSYSLFSCTYIAISNRDNTPLFVLY